VSDVLIPKAAELTAHYDAGLLGGVAAIEGQVVAKTASDWNGKLYRPLEKSPDQSIKVRFIPYYAWSNRGPSEMSVWLPAR
jgi:hypothetical protein